ncbi:MAG: FliI/YscN family ATPase [Phycisphaeraceae bacterium]|jgi:FliI/YscN family ATPase|nr:FliI/YscN family ATPase [Phycisphaeraceae bacterium]
MVSFATEYKMLEVAEPLEFCGVVEEVRGLVVRVADLPVPVGAMVRIELDQHASRCEAARVPGRLNDAARRPHVLGEVIGFNEHQTIIMPMGATTGVRRGNRVISGQSARHALVGDALLGRVVNAMGQPLDGGAPIARMAPWPLTPDPIDPMDRPTIDQPLGTGIRAIDALVTVGQGQRMGVFSSPGLGKSTLLGMMTRHTSADVSVVALVGERGREVRDFLEKHMGAGGLARSVVVCATGDEPAVVRIRAALYATTIAEYFRDQGKDVLLVMDSITRLCQAQRQVGLAIGEPPATKGYTPSVFAMLPALLERSGRTSAGSITGMYAVLIEGDEMTDPVTDAARGILDGHIMLNHDLARQGHWPAIDVLESVSRVADQVTDKPHQQERQQVISLINAYREVEDLLNIGAYAAGSNPRFDLAIASRDVINQLLQQGSDTAITQTFEQTRQILHAMQQNLEHTKRQLEKTMRQPVQTVQGPQVA